MDRRLHITPRMTRVSASALVFCFALSASVAEAQLIDSGIIDSGLGAAGALATSVSNTGGGTIKVTMIKVNETPYTDINLYTEIGDTACKGGNLGGTLGDGTITVNLLNYPNANTYKFLEVWLATGTGNCDAPDRAMRLPSENNCTKLELTRREGDSMACTGFCQNIQVKLGEATCQNDGPRSIYFLALQSSNSAEQAMSFGVITITIDRTPPSVPTDVTGGRAETEIPLTWTQPTEQIITYWTVLDLDGQLSSEADLDAGNVATDAGVMGVNACSSKYLMPGQRFDPSGLGLPKTVITHHLPTKVGSTTFNGDDFLPYTTIAAGVVAQDRAGNLSPMSNIACLQVTPTSGFWDAYKGNGGAADGGCGCSVPGSSSHSSERAWVILLAAAFGLVWRGARRSRRC